MSTILGINAYHGDAAAALVVDGELVAAVEEERFNRVKHWAGFPGAAIRYCLEAGGVRVEEVEHVAISFDPRANAAKRVQFVLQNRPSARAVLDRVMRQGKTLGLEEQFAQAVGCGRGDLRARFHRIEHHSTHVAAGFLLSPFEKAAILSVDGMGDFTSTVTALGEGTGWRELERVYFPHSIGFLYCALTMYLGFPHYGDEYKVMGLAPYGEPEYLDEMREVIVTKGDTFALNLDFFTHHKNGVRMSWNDGAPVVEPFHSARLERRLGPMRGRGEELTRKHENIAASLQARTEEILMHLLERLYERTKCPRVCLTGGVAMNSVANGKVTRLTPFEEVYVPAGAADNGTSFGAAFYVWCRELGQARRFVQRHAYWGWEAPEAQCEEAIRAFGLPMASYEEEELVEVTCEAILEGKVVGWYQGRMEFGARALGNRSLLADPRRTDMRDIINLRIKFREKFRPFAPSILEEEVVNWFEIDEAAPYMEKVLPIRKEKRELIPAVTHVDGSGRLQSVSRETNSLYYALIAKFRDKTGVPILLNTSLNENEPIVRTPEEAIRCFLRTEMDVLVLGRYVVGRRGMKDEGGEEVG